MLSAAHLVHLYERGEVSPVEVMRAVLERIERWDGTLNAFCAIDAEGALAAAAESERRWRANAALSHIDGVPVSVKDLVPMAGLPTRLGSRAIEVGAIADRDAPSAAWLREAGAVFFGKTNTSEFGNKIVTENPLSGATRNPWASDRSAGGSSGGSGAAVAAGMGPLALATDGGGSIRIPAGWNGVVGFKPSFKRVPSDGTELFALSNLGPIARTVRDAARMLTVLTGPCDRDWERVPADGHDYESGLARGISGLKIAFSPDLGLVEVAPDIARVVRAAVGLLSDLGAQVEEVAVPPLRTYLSSRMHSIQWMVRLARLVDEFPPGRRDLLDPDTLALAEIGKGLPLAALADAFAMRQRLGRDMHLFLSDYDMLVTPTFHVSAPLAPGLPPELQTAPPLTSWCNQTLQPAISIPCGFDANGIPVGLQMVGRRFSDAMVLRAASAYEAARGSFPSPHLAN